MMKVRSLALIAVALAAVPCATPAFAHGWPVPVGGGTPTFQGPAGGGNNNNNNTQPVGGGGGEWAGPSGGIDCGPGVVAAPPPPPIGATSSAGARGGATAPMKAKSGATPWMTRVRVPWTPAFLPTTANDGYAPKTGTIADALKLSPADGGWSRDQRPVMVFSYDATNADHRRVLSTLDADGRIRSASWFFNCFRVDTGASAEAGKALDARLSVFTADGTLVGEVTGQRKMSAVFDLMESAWQKNGGADLTNKVPKMDGFLKTRAYAEHFIPLCEVGIVCPDCGHERTDVLERIAELKARVEACDRGIDELRTVARK